MIAELLQIHGGMLTFFVILTTFSVLGWVFDK